MDKIIEEILTAQTIAVNIGVGSRRTRVSKMIQWLVDNQNQIDGEKNGNLQFSFVDSTLKVKTEKFENIT